MISSKSTTIHSLMQRLSLTAIRCSNSFRVNSASGIPAKVLPMPGLTLYSCQPFTQSLHFSSFRAHKDLPKLNIRTHAVNVINGNYDDLDAAESSSDLTDAKYDDFSEALNTNIKGLYDSVDEYTRTQDKGREDVSQSFLQMHRDQELERQRREERSKPVVRVQEIDDRGRAYGRGGRKTATARVWIQPGDGIVTINRREFLDYFPRDKDRELIISPFVATNTCGRFDVTVSVEGGGITGKAGAIRHGISRALEKYNPEYRPALKRLGFLTRDPRVVERKKIGHKKARRKPQWVRR